MGAKRARRSYTVSDSAGFRSQKSAILNIKLHIFTADKKIFF